MNSRHRDIRATIVIALLTITGAGAFLLGQIRSEATQIPAASVDMPPTSIDRYSSGSTDDALCGSVRLINTLVVSAQHDRLDPGPAAPYPTLGSRPPTDFIGLAGALNTAAAEQHPSPTMGPALLSYVYALTNLGAAVNHRDAEESVDAMYQWTELSGQAVTALCDLVISADPQR